MAPLRIFVAGLFHETNSFSPLPTSLRSYDENGWYRPPSADARNEALAFAGYGDAIAVIAARGDIAVEGPFAWAQPSGLTLASAYTDLRETLLADLSAAAGSIDAVLLVLHGAMAAEGTADCEADILAAARAIVGPDIPLGAILDLHGNIAPQTVESGALLVGVKEYPHTDYRARVEELHAMLAKAARGGARLRSSLRTIPFLGIQGTTGAPMRDFVASLQAREGKDGIHNVTLMHGFPWTDWEEAGASVLIVSEGVGTARLRAMGDEIADEFLGIVRTLPPERVSAAEAVSRALAVPAGPGPVVIADAADNPGGGAAGDSNFLLAELLARGCTNCALGMIWDPQAVALAADAGEGARLPIRIGGKYGPASGDPLDLDVEVLRVRSDARQRFFGETPNAPLGLTVALRVGGIDLVVNSIRQQVFDPACFTGMGIDLASKAIVTVKSTNHFRALFDPVARAVIICDTPGTASTDFASLPYRHLRLAHHRAGTIADRPIRYAEGPE